MSAENRAIELWNAVAGVEEHEVVLPIFEKIFRDADALRDLIADLSAALTDEGPSWSAEGVANLRRRVTEALPNDGRAEWLKPYVADGV